MVNQLRRIQDFFKNLGTESRAAFQSMPFTMVLTVLWTIAMVLEDVSFIVEWDKRLISFYLGFFMAGSLLVESLFDKRCKSRYLLEGIPAVMAGVFVYLLGKEQPFYYNVVIHKGEVYWGGVHRFIAGYCAIMILCTIFVMYKKSKLSIETYCLKAFQQICRVTIIYVVISLGCAGILWSFVTLLLNGRHVELLVKLEVIVFGLYYLPSLALSLRAGEEEVSSFFERIVKFVLFPMITGALLIVYLYLGKLLIPFTMPSNQIFKMLAALFVFGAIVWTLLGHFHDDTLVMRVAEKMPYTFLPLLLLQGYTLGIRLSTYGMTPNRYLGMLFMLFEFFYFCIYRLRRDKISIMLILLSIMIFVATWMPGINMMDLSIRNQKAILEQYTSINIKDTPREVWKRMYGAYCFLSQQPECEVYLDKNYDEEDIALLQSYGGPEIGVGQDIVKIYEDNISIQINVTEYHSMQKVWTESQYDSDLAQAMLMTQGREGDVFLQDIDLQKIFSEFMSQYNKYGDADKSGFYEYLRGHNLVVLSDKQDFYMDSISFSFDRSTGDVLQYRITGYLLQR